jgi:hypothetical protein
MSDGIDLIIRAIDKASSEFKKIGASLGSLKSTWTEFNNMLGVADRVMRTAQKAYQQTVGAVIDYNKSMLDAARSTRMGVEDLSRFVQVGDDMGVGIDSITRALQMATKNGFAPSISAIADLADRANALSTPTERAATLAKMFGRNWAELDPILQLGGQGIRDLAAAQADGLVVTEAEIKKTEELRLRVDALTDTWIAYRNEIGLQAVEIIDLNVRATQLTNTWAAQRQELTGQKPAFLEYIKNWHTTEEALRGAVGVMETGIVRAGLLRAEIETSPSPWTITNTIITKHIDVYGEEGMGGTGEDPGSKKTGLYRTDPDGTKWAYYGGKWNKISEATIDTSEGRGSAMGADFVVPPGFPNDSFPMRVESGEHVTVTPAGEKSKSGANVTINVSSTPMDVQWITKQLKSAVGM